MPRGKRNPVPAQLTIEYLRSVLDYDPETGIFIWKVNTSRKPMAGKVAGSVGKWGYRTIGICNSGGVERCKVKAHRLAWFYVTGEWPDGDIDHKNLRRDDNRFENLRPATRPQNNINAVIHSNNSSGFKGVGWHKQIGRWRAYLTVNKRQRSLGLFDTKEEAAAARDRAELAAYGEFSRVKIAC